MNTIEELVSEYGFNEKTAEYMLKVYNSHIGEVHGINTITDIRYVGDSTKEIDITCSKCGKITQRHFRNSKNRWDRIRQNCECQSKKFSKNKKDGFNNHDESWIGKEINHSRIIGFDYKPNNGSSGGTNLWICECTLCGSKRILTPADVKADRRKCGCRSAEKYTNEIGKTYNRLTVISVSKEKGKNAVAKCQCECGNIKEIQLANVKSGLVKSCGCLSQELQDNALSSSPLYSTYNGMMYRCNNPNSNGYKDYGGRGIKVCKEWENDFWAFETWSYENGYIPNNGLSLDRIDVNKGYSPDNCRWANKYVQAVNRRPKTLVNNGVTINGVTKSRSEWCKEYGVWGSTVRYREKNMGMTFEEALTAEKQREGNHTPVTKSKAKEVDKIVNNCKSYIETNLYLTFANATNKYRLIPQYKIGKYYIDFLIDGTRIGIECDGYDYHKTKEQLEHDCKRERYLISEGYTILRYSGSEINADPNKCANELIEMIETLA